MGKVKESPTQKIFFCLKLCSRPSDYKDNPDLIHFKKIK